MRVAALLADLAAEVAMEMGVVFAIESGLVRVELRVVVEVELEVVVRVEVTSLSDRLAERSSISPLVSLRSRRFH